MIILPNKNEKYVKEMNSLIFSHDIEEQIMSNILKHKKKNINIYIYMVALITIFVCIIVIRYINVPNKMKSEFLCEEDIEKIGYVSNVKEFKIDVNNNIDNLEICPNQMVILNIQNIQCETSSIFLKGHLVGDDREYSLGYIVDKKYTEVLSDCTEEFVSNEMDIKDGTEYSLYIINCSNKILTFSGNVFANLDDLIYHDYGNESLRVEENSNIIIDLSGLSNSRDIEGIYVYNCITRQTVKFQFSRLIEYESQQEGIYLVYAMTVQGEIIDLSKYVTIEYSINEGNGIIGL
jgi:hypothetical protein